MTLDLQKIHKTKVHVKSEKILKISDEFMITPACHSEYIKADYCLKVKVGYEGCCSGIPDACVPLSILPIFGPEKYGFDSDENSTTELGYFTFKL